MNKESLIENLKVHYVSMPGFLKVPVKRMLFKRELKKAMSDFLSEQEKSNKALRREIENDIWRCKKLYSIKPNEYFLFGFRDIDDEKRESFLTDNIKDSTLRKVVDYRVFLDEMRNKYNFYKLTAQYFKRPVMFLNAETDIEEFCDFCVSNSDLFIKNNSSSKGRGAMTASVKNREDAVNLYAKLTAGGGNYIIEKKISQALEMSQWNESSVNTIRLPSFLSKDGFRVLAPFMRIGRKGSIVDNAAKGGIIVCIDPETGTMLTDGVDEKGHYYTKHPDSGLTFKGWQVPHWKELISLAEEIQNTLPHHKYIGWDFALSDNGWVLIEGNWGQFLSQYNDHIGLKRQFFELLGIK